MSATNVQQLLEEDPSLSESIETVIERSDEGTRPIQWADVSDELTTGQWGRLIEHDVVEDTGDGFRPTDIDSLREALESETTTPAEDDGAWSTYDKAAGLLAVVLFMGYSMPQVRATIAHVDGVFLEPLDAVLPFHIVILTLAVVTGLYSALLQSALLDTDKMAEYQQRMQTIQERRKAAKERGDEEALEEIREEQMDAMGDNMGMFTLQFRPMVWIMLVSIPVFLWMRWKLNGHVDPAELRVVFPLVGHIGLRTGSVGPVPAWIGWYFLCSMGFGQIVRKALNLQTSPDAA